MTTEREQSQGGGRGIEYLAGKYLTYALSEERYGLQILKVQEIIGMMHITKVPKTHGHLKGVINLRGKIIPVVDLRLKFGLPERAYDEKTCIIVVQIASGEAARSVGVIVDTVLEVLNFTAAQLEPAPDYGVTLETNFLLAIGRSQDNSVTILIDIERALHEAGVSLAAEAAQSEEAAAH